MTDFKTLTKNWNQWLLSEQSIARDIKDPAVKSVWRQVQSVLHPDKIGNHSPEKIRDAIKKAEALKKNPGFPKRGHHQLNKAMELGRSKVQFGRGAKKKPTKAKTAQAKQRPPKGPSGGGGGGPNKPSGGSKSSKTGGQTGGRTAGAGQGPPGGGGGGGPSGGSGASTNPGGGAKTSSAGGAGGSQPPKPPGGGGGGPKPPAGGGKKPPKALVDKVMKTGVGRKTAETAVKRLALRGAVGVAGRAAAATLLGPIGIAAFTAYEIWNIYDTWNKESKGVNVWGLTKDAITGNHAYAKSNPHKKGCAAEVADKSKSLSADCWSHWPKESQCGWCKKQKVRPYLNRSKKILAKGPSCADVLKTCGKVGPKPKPGPKGSGKCGINKRYNKELGISMKQIQTKLKEKGHNPGPIDGICGSKTLAAIRSFQKANGLKVDSIVGPKTWAKLGASKKKAKKAPEIKDDLPGNARGAMVALPDGSHQRMDQFKKRFKDDPKAKQNKKERKDKLKEQLERIIMEEIYNVLSERSRNGRR